jgi:hypothetical protein
VKQKKDGGGLEKVLLTIHLKKLSFGKELGELTRVSAGNPFRCSDSAVKLSALAVRLEKPFRFFICRHWHFDSKIFIEGGILFADLGGEVDFGCVATFPGVWRPSYSLLDRVSSTWANLLAVGRISLLRQRCFPVGRDFWL